MVDWFDMVWRQRSMIQRERERYGRVHKGVFGLPSSEVHEPLLTIFSKKKFDLSFIKTLVSYKQCSVLKIY